MRFIDLSTPVDAEGWEPDPVEHRVLSPAEGAKHMSEEMRAHFGVELDITELPDQELLSVDTLTLTSHTGTHVDAPSHYGSVARYGDGRPRSIDELPLDWFHGPGLVLDCTDAGPGAVDADLLRERIERVRPPRPGDLVLLHTGADRLAGTPAYFTDFTGLDASATELLLDAGVRVIGTDAFSLDAPFRDMIDRFHETGDHGVLWPAHFLGRSRPYCQIERLSGLHTLPAPDGFTLSCFPVKIKGGGAGWARAVAIFP
ncbi:MULTISPECIES: cyclase family protein [unclassified Streptomyces]|uniref:cyclase family protein n=1 Tax=unclassified Streptomyces TaxID=2593676 RepID=UPI0024A87858|nr:MULTISPECIES: cyclase family protein [unclassified Streptomyces]